MRHIEDAYEKPDSIKRHIVAVAFGIQKDALEEIRLRGKDAYGTWVDEYIINSTHFSHI